MDDGQRRTTFIRTPAMAVSSRTSWGGLKVIYLVVNEPGGSGSTSTSSNACNQHRVSGLRCWETSMASSVIRKSPFIIITLLSFLSSFQLSSLFSDSVLLSFKIWYVDHVWHVCLDPEPVSQKSPKTYSRYIYNTSLRAFL